MFNSMSLKQKIITGGIVPLILLGVVNVIGLIQFNDNLASDKWVSHTQHTIELGDSFEKLAVDMETSERGYLLTGDEAFLEPYIQGEKDKESFIQELKLSVKDEEALQNITNAYAVLSKWETEIADKYIQKRKDMRDYPLALKTVSDLVAEKKGKEHFDQFRGYMQKFKEREHSLLTEREKMSAADAQMTGRIIIMGTVGALLLAILISMFMVKMILDPIRIVKDAAIRISKGETVIAIDVNSGDELGEMADAFKAMIRSLNDITDIAHQIGKGNLDVSVIKRSENDELSGALASMVLNLNAIMNEVKEGMLSLNSAASEIFATTAQVSSAASQTSASVTQTSASIEEIKQTAKKSSAKAMQTADSAGKTMEIAKMGSQELLNNMRGLEQIKEKMDMIASNIIQLSDQSQMISEIITTVEDIANQSNLLAVNASIEAVKAGEHGKGFSVVSQELKNLAEQSKQGTKQVQKIIFDIQKVTGTLVMVAEQGGKAVMNGVQQAQNAKISMDQLNEIVINSANTGKQIVASYEQELAGMDQISSAMGSIKDATAQNLSSIKQVEVSAKDLNTLSHNLKHVMDRYTISDKK